MFARKKERALEKRLRTGRINKAEKLAKGVTQRPRGRSPKRQAWICLLVQQDGRTIHLRGW